MSPLFAACPTALLATEFLEGVSKINQKAEHLNFNLLHAAAFKFRGLSMVPLIVFVLLCVKWEWENHLGVCGLGLLLFGAGLGLRAWAQRHFKYRLRSGDEHHLAVTGPFAYCRNPVYIGNVLLLAGITVFCGLLWVVPFVVLWGGLIYTLSVRFEEFRLTKRFGTEYSDYCAAVPRWLPAFPSPSSSSSSALLGDAELAAEPPASWPLVLRAEWQCLVLLLVPVVKMVVINSSFHVLGSAWLVSFDSFGG